MSAAAVLFCLILYISIIVVLPHCTASLCDSRNLLLTCMARDKQDWPTKESLGAHLLLLLKVNHAQMSWRRLVVNRENTDSWIASHWRSRYTHVQKLHAGSDLMKVSEDNNTSLKIPWNCLNKKFLHVYSLFCRGMQSIVLTNHSNLLHC